MKDYYQILELDKGADQEQVRKAYRRLALLHHPDRNPDDREAADRFRGIAEAYGVLSDQEKRQRYDRLCSQSGPERSQDQEFDFSQEEILKDLFDSPQFKSMLNSMMQEFGRQGFRADHRFMQSTFMGGRGIFFGGIFLWRVLGPRGLKLPGAAKGLRSLAVSGMARSAGRLLGSLLKGGPALSSNQEQTVSMPESSAGDLEYLLPLAPGLAAHGAQVMIKIDCSGCLQTLKVRVPAGIKDGAKLRLQGRGMEVNGRRGDLYVVVSLQ